MEQEKVVSWDENLEEYIGNNEFVVSTQSYTLVYVVIGLLLLIVLIYVSMNSCNDKIETTRKDKSNK